jgi:hypothetical protein
MLSVAAQLHLWAKCGRDSPEQPLAEEAAAGLAEEAVAPDVRWGGRSLSPGPRTSSGLQCIQALRTLCYLEKKKPLHVHAIGRCRTY